MGRVLGSITAMSAGSHRRLRRTIAPQADPPAGLPMCGVRDSRRRNLETYRGFVYPWVMDDLGHMNVQSYRGFVYPWVMDDLGHMNVQSYVARFDEASWHFAAALGLTPGYLKENRKSLVALEQTTRYRLEVLSGSLLEVRTELLETGRKTLRFAHRMYNSESGLEVAEMQILAVYSGLQTRRSAELPAFVPEKAEDV